MVDILKLSKLSHFTLAIQLASIQQNVLVCGVKLRTLDRMNILNSQVSYSKWYFKNPIQMFSFEIFVFGDKLSKRRKMFDFNSFVRRNIYTYVYIFCKGRLKSSLLTTNIIPLYLFSYYLTHHYWFYVVLSLTTRYQLYTHLSRLNR